MRFVLALLAVIGIAASSLALREHYRTDTSPCSINEKWDCGIVNHSPYAVLWGVPVATIGIAGYLLLGILALKRWYRLLLPLSLARARVLALPGAHRSASSGGLVHLLCGVSGRDFCLQSAGAGDGSEPSSQVGKPRRTLRSLEGILIEVYASLLADLGQTLRPFSLCTDLLQAQPAVLHYSGPGPRDIPSRTQFFPSCPR